MVDESSSSDKENLIFSPNVSNLSLDFDNSNSKFINSDVELSLDNLSIDKPRITQNKRYSEFFRAQLSHLDIQSPDISFSLDGSQNNDKLSIDNDTSCKSNCSPDLSVDNELSLNLSLNLSLDVSTEPLKVASLSPDVCRSMANDLSLDVSDLPSLVESPVRNKSWSDDKLRSKKESGSSLDDEVVVTRKGQARTMLDSESESDSEFNKSKAAALDLRDSSRTEFDKAHSFEESDEYDESFIDDEAIEDNNTSVAFEIDSEPSFSPRAKPSSSGQYRPASESEDGEYDESFIDDTEYNKVRSESEHSEASSASDEESFVISPVKKTSFKTPQNQRSFKTSQKQPSFKTPQSKALLPASYLTPVPLNKRRTCIATPLSVTSKTGTPGAPNRVFKRNFISLATELYHQFNESVFSSQLPHDLEIKSNKRLNTTAGRCVYLRKKDIYSVYIELSPKVVDCLDRLKETLAHEMCHAAAFIIDHKMDQHGPIWKKWAKRTNVKYPELPPVSRCHSYEIKYKFNYTCVEEWCNYTIGNYSLSLLTFYFATRFITSKVNNNNITLLLLVSVRM